MKPIMHAPVCRAGTGRPSPGLAPNPKIGDRQVKEIEAMLLQPEAYTLAERRALGYDLEPDERSIADILKTMP